MGTTHFRSNVRGKAGTETITNFATISGTTVSGTTVSGTAVSGTTLSATSYIKVGSCYIFYGSVTNNSASVVAAASALITTASLSGSIFLDPTSTWKFTATNVATQM